MQERQQVGVLCIATNKYKKFVQPLIDGIKQYLFLNSNIRVFLFIDEFGSYVGDDRVKIELHPIPSYGFPDATMRRYEIFNAHRRILQEVDYLLYSDVDMKIVSEIDESILDNLIAVRHPGFHMNNGGSWETRKESTCYVPEHNRIAYYAGGVQGGDVYDYLAAIGTMSLMIQVDLENGITPVWHDESAWNKYLSEQRPYKILYPDYCMVENITLREKWGINDLEPKIIALDKNHSEIRS